MVRRVVRLLFRLRIGSAGLFQDKKRCRMVSYERCVMCDSGVGEDVVNFLVRCGKIERDRLVLLMYAELWGAREWLDEFCRVDKEGKVALLLEKRGGGICNRVMEYVGSVYCIGWADGGREGSNCCMGRLLLDIAPFSSPLSLLEQLETIHSF